MHSVPCPCGLPSGRLQGETRSCFSLEDSGNRTCAPLAAPALFDPALARAPHPVDASASLSLHLGALVDLQTDGHIKSLKGRSRRLISDGYKQARDNLSHEIQSKRYTYSKSKASHTRTNESQTGLSLSMAGLCGESGSSGSAPSPAPSSTQSASLRSMRNPPSCSRARGSSC